MEIQLVQLGLLIKQPPGDTISTPRIIDKTAPLDIQLVHLGLLIKQLLGDTISTTRIIDKTAPWRYN